MENCTRFTGAEGGARLAGAARSGNTLAADHTTFIATTLLHEEAYKIRGSCLGGSQRSVYVSRASRVKCVAYDLNILTDLTIVSAINYEDVDDWHRELELKEVLVCTSKVIKKILEDKLLSMENINVLILESSHLICRDEDMKFIMKLYKECKGNCPRILALTYPLFSQNKKDKSNSALREEKNKNDESISDISDNLESNTDEIDTEKDYINNGTKGEDDTKEEIDVVETKFEIDVDDINAGDVADADNHHASDSVSIVESDNVDEFDMYEKLEWKIDVLESELCCRADFAEDIDNVKRLSASVSKPKELIVEHSGQADSVALPQDYVELEQFMRDSVNEAMGFLNEHRYDPTEIYGEDLYEELKSIPDPTLEPKQIFKQFLYILDQLGPYGADKAAFSLLIKLEKLKIKVPYERHFLLLCLCSSVFVKIRCAADTICQNYDNDWVRIKQLSTPKVLRFTEILQMFKPPSELSVAAKHERQRNPNDGKESEVVESKLSDIDKCDFLTLSDKIKDKINTFESNLCELPDGKRNWVENKRFHGSNATRGSVFGLPKRSNVRLRGKGRVPRSNAARVQQMLANPDALCGIIYMKDPLMAKILFMLVVELSRNHPNLNFLCAQYFAIDKPADPIKEPKEFEQQRRKQEDVLKKFRMYECNLLLATPALEEGIDLPRCNLILRWDMPPSYRSYGLCRGRARAPRSTYVLMSSPDQYNTDTLLHNVATYKELDRVISRKCGCGVQNEPPPSEEELADSLSALVTPYTPTETKHKEDRTRQPNEVIVCDKCNRETIVCLCEKVKVNDSVASVDLNSAITLINRYCGKLPSDTFTRLAPQWWMEEVDLPLRNLPDVTKKAYICTLRLPLNCPVKYHIVGHPMPTRVLARRMVALQACRILHKSGELDNQLMPIGKENFKAPESTNVPIISDYMMNSVSEANDLARPGTTKRRQYYYKRTAWAFTDCQPIIDTEDTELTANESVRSKDWPNNFTEEVLPKNIGNTGEKRNMLYAIVCRLWCALPERYNTRGRRLHAPQHARQALGILMARTHSDNLQIPSFPIYTRSGEVRVSVEPVPEADVRVSPRRGRLVRRFMRFVFAEVLRVRRRGMKLQSEGSTHNNYYIVPTVKTIKGDGSTKIDIDWSFLELIYQHTEEKKHSEIERPILWHQDEEEEEDLKCDRKCDSVTDYVDGVKPSDSEASGNKDHAIDRNIKENIGNPNDEVESSNEIFDDIANRDMKNSNEQNIQRVSEDKAVFISNENNKIINSHVKVQSSNDITINISDNIASSDMKVKEEQNEKDTGEAEVILSNDNVVNLDDNESSNDITVDITENEKGAEAEEVVSPNDNINHESKFDKCCNRINKVVKKMRNPLLKPGEMFSFDPERYREAVVTPWYRNQDQPQFFLVAEICSNLSPDSAFPSATHTTFRNYYTRKYGVELTQPDQPLLDVDHTSARLNLLTPRYVNRKGVALPVSSERTRRAKRDRLDQKQILVPELCRVHPFAAPLWFATVALPCVLYRINALLIADEIRRCVAIDVGLGVPKINEESCPGFEWPPLDFGWSLAEVLSVDSEIAEKSGKEEIIEEPKEVIEESKVKEAEEEVVVESEKVEKTVNDILQEKEDAESGFEIGTWSNDMASAIPNTVEYDEYMEPLPSNLTFCTSASGGTNWCDPITPKPKSNFNASRAFSVAESDCSYLSSDFDTDDSDLNSDNSDEDTDTSGFFSCRNSNAMGVRIEYKTAHEAEAVDLKRERKVTLAPQPDLDDDEQDRLLQEMYLNTGEAPQQYIENFKKSVEIHKKEILENNLLIREDKAITGILPEIKNNIKLDSIKVYENETNKEELDNRFNEIFPYESDINLIEDGQVSLENIEKNKRILLNKLKEKLSKDELKKFNCFSMKDVNVDSSDYINEKLVNIGFDNKELYVKKLNRVNSDEDAMQKELYVQDNKVQNKKKNFDFDYQPKLDGHPGPSPSVILQALTMSNANDGINLERLETIGDSFLKFAITAYLYCAHPTVHEGKLSHMRSKQVSNLSLYRLGRNKRLGARMIASKFEPHDNWLPPCHKPPPTLGPRPPSEVNMGQTSHCPIHGAFKMQSYMHQRCTCYLDGVADRTGCFIPYNLITQHSIPDKSIADCVEALIGAYLIECGPRGALLFMSWLGIQVLPRHDVPLSGEHPYVVADLDNKKTAEDHVKSPSRAPTRAETETESESEEWSEEEVQGVEPVLGEECELCEDWTWSGRTVGSLRPYRTDTGQWMQPVFGELKAPPSPLLRYIDDPEGELEQMLSGYDALEETLQYRFRDRSLLLQALTHASHQQNRLTDCYQRLEFLGDAILDYLITRYLYEDERRHSPGALTDLRSALVNNTIFATLAVRHGFHKYFRHMSPGLYEVLTKYVKIQEENGHSISEEHYLIQEDEMEQAEDVEVPKALGDLFESVAGAIFLDSGMSLGAVWKSYVNLMGVELEAFSAAAPKSPVRELLEAEPDTAKFGKPERLADGRRVRVCVEVFGRGTFKGVGRNYRIAKGTAARCALRHLKRAHRA